MDGKYTTTTLGKPTTLTSEEEVALIHYIDYMHGRHFPLNLAQVKAFAWQIALRSGRKNKFGAEGPTEKWWRCFKARHPNVSMHVADNLDRGRHRMSNRNVYLRYFENIKPCINETISAVHLKIKHLDKKKKFIYK